MVQPGDFQQIAATRMEGIQQYQRTDSSLQRTIERMGR
jgi:hypothetical protein